MYGTLDYEAENWCNVSYINEAENEGYLFVHKDDGYAQKLQKFFDNCYNILHKKIKLQESFQYKNVADENGNKLFTNDLLGELEHFIIEDDLNVDTISDNRALLYYAENYMKYINKIPTTFDVDAIDILDSQQHQVLWDKLTDVGDYIMIDCPDLHLNKEYCRLISYTHNPKSCSFSMKFSNEDEIKDAYNTFINGVVKVALDLSKSAKNYQDSWDEYLQKKDLYLQEGVDIDAQINSIVAGGKPVIGKSGLVVSAQPGNGIKQLSDGVYCAGSSNGIDETGSNIFNSDTGLAMDITVNSVKTDYKRAYNYLNGIKDNLNYEYLHDEKFLFISDVFESESPIHIGYNANTPMYWKEDPETWQGGKTLENIRKQMTANVTDFKVFAYTYKSYVKGSWSFESEDYILDGTTIKNEIPVLRLGTGLNDGTDKGQAIIKKENDGLYVSYVSRTDGKERGIFIDDTNIYQVMGDKKVPIPIINITTDELEATKNYVADELYFVIKE